MTKDLRTAGESTEPWGGDMPLCMDCAALWRLATGRGLGTEKGDGEDGKERKKEKGSKGNLIKDGFGRVIGSSVWNGQGSLLDEGREIEQLGVRSHARSATPAGRLPVT